MRHWVCGTSLRPGLRPPTATVPTTCRAALPPPSTKCAIRCTQLLASSRQRQTPLWQSQIYLDSAPVALYITLAPTNLSVWTNTFSYLDNYILQTGQVHFAKADLPAPLSLHPNCSLLQPMYLGVAPPLPWNLGFFCQSPNILASAYSSPLLFSSQLPFLVWASQFSGRPSQVRPICGRGLPRTTS